MREVRKTVMLSGATAVSRGGRQRLVAERPYSFEIDGTTSAGAGACVVKIHVSNEENPTDSTDVDWVEAGELTLTLGTTKTKDALAVESLPYVWVRFKVESISGTTATVNGRMAG